MLSTCSIATMTTVTSRRKRSSTNKPLVIDSYNHHMNGVDLADQNAVYYSFIRKTVKWWRKVAFWLLETAVVNSYILYTKTVPAPKSHIVFRRLLIESLASRHIVSAPPRPHVGHIVSAPPRPHVGRPRKRSHPDGDVPERQLHIMDQRTQWNCVVCRAAGKQSRPLNYCKTCPEHHQLCIGYCFERYHTVLNY